MTDIETLERVEKQQRDQVYDKVVSRNKYIKYHQENTMKLNEARDIFKDSSGLDNISEFDMKKFKQIMLGGR